MGKVIYFKSPLNEQNNVQIESENSIKDVLEFIGIEKDPLSITINGETPDDVDIDYKLQENDVIEIRRIVEGGGNSSTKSTLATIVQITALVASSFFTGGAAALIIIGGSIISGALNKWANDLLMAEMGNDEQSGSIDSNGYSLRTAQNEVRSLRPIPLVLGSHRMAPDVHTNFFKFNYGGTYTLTTSPPIEESIFSGALWQGPLNPATNWVEMPAGYITPGFPQYRIMIWPYGLIDPAELNTSELLTNAQKTAILNKIRDNYKNPARMNFNYDQDLGIPSFEYQSFPIMIYHISSGDPYRWRFNFFWCIQRVFQKFPSDYTKMGDIFNGSIPSGADNSFFYDGAVLPQNLLLRAVNYQNTPYIPTSLNPATLSTLFSSLGSYLLNHLNFGSYPASPPVNPLSVVPNTLLNFYFDFSPQQVKQGIPISTQVFNYGFGDLEITDKKVGLVDIGNSNSKILGTSFVDKANVNDDLRWRIPSKTVSGIGTLNFFSDVLATPPKQLINPDFSTAIVPPYGADLSNFVYFSGQVGMDSFKFSIAGRVYGTTGSGMVNNSTRLQVQWKWSGDTGWSFYKTPIITITNNKTNELYLTYYLNKSELGASFDISRAVDEYLEIRIRKVNSDASDRESGKVSDISVVDAYFYASEEFCEDNQKFRVNAPMNIEGLYTTALVSDSSNTNRFTALVENKCWYWDEILEDWVWGKTRNPAWWFLYFAHGGFYNFDSDGTGIWPNSPTIGWQNYPIDTNNSEHIFGGGYRNEQIDIEKIKEWAIFCYDNNLNVDMIIKNEESVADTLEKIANVGRASVTYYGGKLSVVVEDPDQVPTCLYGMGNIIAGSFKVDYSVGDPIRKVVATFTNRDTWESDIVEAFVPFSSPETVRIIEMTLDGITDKDQAQREVNIIAARQFYQRRTYTWKTDIEGFLARRGDVCYLSHDSTQYGHSGRVAQFIVESGVVTSIKVGSTLDNDLTYITLRTPDGTLYTYECEIINGIIKFIDPYPLNLAPSIVNLEDDNSLSDYAGSIAEDFVFIADIKSTTGKKVRIAQITVTNDNQFEITALDEDPAMWAYEYGSEISPESEDDSAPVLSISGLKYLDLGSGKIRLMWNMENADFAQVIDLSSNLPIEANGQYAFSRGDVVFDLVSGVRYNLEVRPLAVGTPYKSISDQVEVWPL